ncbi:MAG: DUF4160 domain-containing protein [Nitrococcus sp.]|nr:DUF4160 domain-containing protein [Nitrococcus sp.]
MPTVLRIGALRVVVYPNDHRPSHVHVIGQGGEAVFNLRCPDGPPELREGYKFNRPKLIRIRNALPTELAHLGAEWRQIHGPK